MELIKNQLTKPDFSFQKSQDIRDLIDTISQELKVRGNNIVINEKKALKLTLSKFIDINQLRNEVKEYNEDLINYYKRNKVGFSNGQHVNLENEESTVLSNLSGRIYKTRNSIVHSKEGNKSKFTPFRHDRVLRKELPLMRFIAESIILDDAEVK